MITTFKAIYFGWEFQIEVEAPTEAEAKKKFKKGIGEIREARLCTSTPLSIQVAGVASYV